MTLFERFRRWRAWWTVRSSYSGTYQQNDITGERRFVEPTYYELGRPYAPYDLGWLAGYKFDEYPRGYGAPPMPPPSGDD